MKAFFINLTSAPERRRLMELQGERLGLNLERFSAFNSADLPPDMQGEVRRSALRPITDPEFACFFSHRALWWRTARENAPCLILEDDVILSPRLTKLLPTFASLRGVEFLNLENWYLRRLLAKKQIDIGHQFSIYQVFRDRSGLGAFVLWPSGARRLLAGSALISKPIDDYVHAMRGLKSFQVEPALAIQLQLMRRMGLTRPLETKSTIQPARDLPSYPQVQMIAFSDRVFDRIVRLLQRILLWRSADYRVVTMNDDDFRLPAELLRKLYTNLPTRPKPTAGPAA